MVREDAEHLQWLCPELLLLVGGEIRAGNTIVEIWRGWPEKDSLLVLLAKPFLAEPKTLTTDIEYREINDPPHYWKAEYASKTQPHTVACRFAGSI